MDAALAETLGERTVDAIKLDTQGSELDILRGASRALSSCTLIEIEVEFNPIYEGQNLFCDVDRFLRDRGFVCGEYLNSCITRPTRCQRSIFRFDCISHPVPSRTRG